MHKLNLNKKFLSSYIIALIIFTVIFLTIINTLINKSSLNNTLKIYSEALDNKANSLVQYNNNISDSVINEFTKLNKPHPLVFTFFISTANNAILPMERSIELEQEDMKIQDIISITKDNKEQTNHFRLKNHIYIFKQVKGTNYIIGFIIHYKKLLNPINTTKILFIVYFIFLILGIYIFHNISLRRFHTELKTILHTVNKIKIENFKEIDSTDYKNPEINKLVKAFNHLITHIREIYETLEQKVEERTSELYSINQRLEKNQKEILHQNLEIKSAYEALSESQKRYEQLLDNLKEDYYFFSLSPKGELLFVSPSVKTILGYEIKEFRKIKNQIHTQNPLNKKAKEHSNLSLKGIQQSKYLVELFDNKKVPHILEISEVPVFNEEGQLTSIEGIARDITKGIRAEDLIKEKEEKYRLIFNKASDFVIFYEIDKNNMPSKFIEVNDYTIKRLGYSQEELLNMTLNNISSIEIWNDETETNTEDTTFERIWEAKNGTLINVEISSHEFSLKNKRYAIAIARDITERKRAEEEIRFINEELVNQKENLEALVDNLTQTQEQLVQSEKMAALGQLIAGVAHEINTPLGAIKASIGNLTDSLKNALNEISKLITHSSKTDLEFFNKIILLAQNDIPQPATKEKRKIRRELAKKLTQNNVQTLIADDLAEMLIYLNIFNSLDDLLPYLQMENAQEVLHSARNFVSILKNSSTISIAAEKATKTVFALKKYAHRDQIEEKSPADIIDSLETVLTLYHNQLKHGIEVIRNYDKLPVVHCYPDELNQVWTNLIHNAIQAMDQKGILTISATNENESVSISIADNGCGIEPDIQDKIFDPFFTTKKQGEGSGLGLDIVKKIIEKHNGLITFNSELGKGTEFIIRLPAN